MSNFTIPKPCNENWANMLPDEKGKFCALCQKSVHDFTQSTPQEIKNTIDKENGKICGRFREDQLLQNSKFQNIVLKIERFSKNNLSKYGILLSTVSLLMSISGCQKKEKIIGKLKPIKIEKDTTNCKNDSTNTDITLGKILIEPRPDSAQIPKTEKDVHSKTDSKTPPKPLKKTIPIEKPTVVGMIMPAPMPIDSVEKSK